MPPMVVKFMLEGLATLILLFYNITIFIILLKYSSKLKLLHSLSLCIISCNMILIDPIIKFIYLSINLSIYTSVYLTTYLSAIYSHTHTHTIVYIAQSALSHMMPQNKASASVRVTKH